MPAMQMVLVPVRVQGECAANEIAAAIRNVDAWGGADVLIVGRGGGSLEDLWAFNEEQVARAIFECSTPVVSAVGHEVDFTIADFVADVRAATPSAAAEMVAPDKKEMEQHVGNLRYTLVQMVRTHLDSLRQSVENLRNHYALRQPENLVAQYRQRADELDRRLGLGMGRRMEMQIQKVAGLEKHLSVLSPRNTLKRGYTIVRHENTVIQKASELKHQDKASVEFVDGTVNVEVVPP
jgi:exodeoxyribonuclease VII large subunit